MPKATDTLLDDRQRCTEAESSNGSAATEAAAVFDNGLISEKNVEGSENAGAMRLKRRITLVGGVCLIVGSIIGSGIFISPQSVVVHAGSPGLGLVVWTAGGALAFLGGLCFAELGALLPRSGGDYHYIRSAYGDLAGFLLFYSDLIGLRPANLTIAGLMFARYLVYPFYEHCDPPDVALKITAFLCISMFILSRHNYSKCNSLKLLKGFIAENVFIYL